MGEKTPVQIGIVGCGAIAQLVHLPNLSAMDGAIVAAVCDENVAKAKSVARRFAVPATYPSIEGFLEHPGLQAALVCTPNYLHATHTQMALRAGVDVLCERPLATVVEDVEATLAAARKTRRHVMVANNHRYRPDAWALRRFISRGDLGDIFHLQASWQRHRARRPRVSEWRMRREHGGGVVMDLGVTILDLCLWLVGYPTPERLTAYLLDRDNDGVDDSAVALMRLEGKLTCGVEVSWDLAAVEDRQTLVAAGSRGFASLKPFIVQKEAGGKIVDVTPRLAPGTENVYRASYRRELDYFLDVVRGERTEPLPDEQRALMTIVKACYLSSEEGREIVL